MGGDHSQKLQPRRRILLLSGAQTSGSLRNQHCSGKLRDGEFADTTFPGQSQARSWLSYGRPGSFLASRPGSLLPRAEDLGTEILVGGTQRLGTAANEGWFQRRFFCRSKRR